MTTTSPKSSSYKINSAVPWSRITQLFGSADEAECQALDWIRRFHRARGLYQLIEIRRGSSAPNARTVWMLTLSQPRHPAARRQWLVIEYVLDEIAVKMTPFATLKAAREAFHACPASLGLPSGSVSKNTSK